MKLSDRQIENMVKFGSLAAVLAYTCIEAVKEYLRASSE